MIDAPPAPGARRGASSIRLPAAGRPAPTAPGSATVTPSSSGCRFLKADSPASVAFCDTFDAATPNPATRSGDLNATLWGVSRTNMRVNLGQGELNDFLPATLLGCGAPQQVPPRDVRICNGRVLEAAQDGGGQLIVTLYSKQPFDIAGRTGTVVFDLSADSQGRTRRGPSCGTEPTPSSSSRGARPWCRTST